MAQTTKLRITKRLVDVKRHTKKYKIGGKWVTRREAVRLAKKGKISGVQVVGNHIQAIPGKPRLSSLPFEVDA